MWKVKTLLCVDVALGKKLSLNLEVCVFGSPVAPCQRATVQRDGDRGCAGSPMMFLAQLW